LYICSFASPRLPPCSTLFPYTTLFRSVMVVRSFQGMRARPPPSGRNVSRSEQSRIGARRCAGGDTGTGRGDGGDQHGPGPQDRRSEEHTSELQSRFDLVCRLLLEKKKT